MGPLSWIIFGALAGWATSILAGTRYEQGLLQNILIGIVGAFLGGWLFSQVTGSPTYIDWNMNSFAIAVIGSLVLLFLWRLVRRT